MLVHNTCKAPNAGYNSFKELKTAMGSPGKGNAWHHIVEQSQIKKSGFEATQIHNVNNIISIPHGKGSIHAKITSHYNSKPEFTKGITVRQWLSGQSYEKQFEYGMKQLKRYGNITQTNKGYIFEPF